MSDEGRARRLGERIQEIVAETLSSATGMVRTEVGRRTGVKFTPHIQFMRDALPGSVKAIDDLLAQAQQRDRELKTQAAGASHAGEADPYKQDEQ